MQPNFPQISAAFSFEFQLISSKFLWNLLLGLKFSCFLCDVLIETPGTDQLLTSARGEEKLFLI